MSTLFNSGNCGTIIYELTFPVTADAASASAFITLPSSPAYGSISLSTNDPSLARALYYTGTITGYLSVYEAFATGTYY